MGSQRHVWQSNPLLVSAPAPSHPLMHTKETSACIHFLGDADHASLKFAMLLLLEVTQPKTIFSLGCLNSEYLLGPVSPPWLSHTPLESFIVFAGVNSFLLHHHILNLLLTRTYWNTMSSTRERGHQYTSEETKTKFKNRIPTSGTTHIVKAVWLTRSTPSLQTEKLGGISVNPPLTSDIKLYL
jgi:hypothetical protein